MARFPKVSKRRDVLRRLRRDFGFELVHGTKHDMLVRNRLKVPFPRESQKDIDDTLLRVILDQLGISTDDWLS